MNRMLYTILLFLLTLQLFSQVRSVDIIAKGRLDAPCTKHEIKNFTGV